MTPQIDHRHALLMVARAKKRMRVEREAALEELRCWFLAQLDELRWEMAADRAALREALSFATSIVIAAA